MRLKQLLFGLIIVLSLVARSYADSVTSGRIYQSNIPAPTPPTYTITGSASNSQITYYLVCHDVYGGVSSISAPLVVSNAPSVLDSGDFITLSWSNNCASVDVLKNGTSYALATGVVGSTIIDNGQTLQQYQPIPYQGAIRITGPTSFFNSVSYVPASVTVNSSAFNLDASLSNIITATLTTDSTITLTNITMGQNLDVDVLQDSNGEHNISWAVPSGYSLIWATGAAPSINLNPNVHNFFNFVASSNGEIVGQLITNSIGICPTNQYVSGIEPNGAPDCNGISVAQIYGLTNPITPQSYGAAGNGAITNDVSFPSTTSTFGATGTSTSPAAPAGTTSFNNEMLLTVMGFEGGLTPPSDNPTQRVYFAGVSATNEGLYIGDQTVASAGSYNAETGTQTSNPWAAISIPMIPLAGTIISYVGEANAQASGTSVTINVPTGTIGGESEVACIAYNQYNPVMPTNMGWTALANPLVTGGSGVGVNCFYHLAGLNDPSSYTFTCGTACLPGAAIVTYSNVAAFDFPITSASANFSPADLQKAICVAGVGPDTANGVGSQVCGWIRYVGNSTQVYPTFGNVATSGGTPVGITNGSMVWATDDTAAFNNALLALNSNGGTLYIPCGIYGIAENLSSIPALTDVNISGCGAAVPYFYNGSTYASTPTSGTILDFMNTNLNGGFITYSKASEVQPWSALFHMQDLTLWGGAGYNRDGGDAGAGTASGILLQAAGKVTFDRIAVGNFGLDDIYYDQTDSNNFNYLDTLKNSYIELAGSDGVGVTSTTTQQNMDIDQSQFESNGGAGLDLISGGQNFSVINNQFNWNNQNNANPGYAINIQDPVTNSVFEANNFDETNTHSQPFPATANIAGIDWSTNYFNSTTNVTHVKYTAAGTAIPTCGKSYANQVACVGDISALTAGTTYSGGGSTTAQVECNWPTTNNWISTGSTKGCY